MKKIISLVLCMLMLAALAVPAIADVDSTVSYALTLEASQPKNGEVYSEGEAVVLTVAVSTRDALGNEDSNLTTAPIYAFNGTLNYNSFLLGLSEVTAPGAFNGMICRDDAANGKVTFSYICPVSGSKLMGVKVDAEFVLVQFKFKALKNGISPVSLSDIVFTDKDANARPIVSADTRLEISIGNGETVSDAQTLSQSIETAKKELAAAVMSQSAELVYPAFTVTKATYDAFDAAIKAAEAALTTAELPDEFLEAERALLSAMHAYDSAKIYGKRPSDDISGIIGGLIVGEKDKEQSLIAVTAAAGENGKIADGYAEQLVRRGTSATVIAIPDEGYEVEKIVVNGKEYPADDTVTIASVTEKTHVEFYFTKKARFSDVAKGAWYYEAVEKIAEMGLFAGTSETEFSPDTAMTRAMLVTVLHRLDGKPAAEANPAFMDVAPNMWYTDAIAWASANGIVNGYTADTFGTNDSISRQDMVTILYRYLKYKGMTPEEGASLDAYTDAGNVSDYAKPAMEWAYAEGLIKGTSDTTLSPKDNCTRAQVATIILRYTENITAE